MEAAFTFVWLRSALVARLGQRHGESIPKPTGRESFVVPSPAPLGQGWGRIFPGGALEGDTASREPWHRVPRLFTASPVTVPERPRAGAGAWAGGLRGGRPPPAHPATCPSPPGQSTPGLGRGVRVAPSPPGRAGAARSSPALREEGSGQKRPVTFRSEEGSLGTPWRSALAKPVEAMRARPRAPPVLRVSSLCSCSQSDAAARGLGSGGGARVPIQGLLSLFFPLLRRSFPTFPLPRLCAARWA